MTIYQDSVHWSWFVLLEIEPRQLLSSNPPLSSSPTFSSGKSLHIDFDSGCTSVRLYRPWIRIPLSHILANILCHLSSWCSSFWQVWWNLKAVLVVLLMSKDVEHLKYLFSICVFFFSWELFGSLTHLLIRRFAIRVLNFCRSLYSLILNPRQSFSLFCSLVSYFSL